METITRTSCRLCGSENLEDVFSLGEQYINDFVPKEMVGKGMKAPLDLVICYNCQLLQLRHTAPQELLYSRHYWYRSGINPVIIKDLKQITEIAQIMVLLKKKDIILDIGANDGTMLKYYSKDLIKVGCEPANNLIEKLRKVTSYVIHDFWSYKAWENKFGAKKAKIITAIGMFYDMENPNHFIRDAAKALDENGIFIAQLMCLRPMLEKNDMGNICVKPTTIILGDNMPISAFSINNHALSDKGRLSKINNVMQRKYEGPLFEIKPMYLEPIVTTPEHPIMIIKKKYFRYPCGQTKSIVDNYKIAWVPAKQVERGDWVVIPRLRHKKTCNFLDLKKFNKIGSIGYRGGLLKFPLNKDSAWLLGLYVAEGHIGGRLSNPYINFTLHKKETDLSRKIRLIFDSFNYKVNTIFPNNRESMEIRIVCAALARAFIEWFRKGAVNKKIPDFIMFAEEEIKSAFIRGLFEGDGYISGNKVNFHTSSRVLALQVQLLVASMGGMLGISYVKPYPREIRSGKVNSKDSWQLRGSSKALAKIFGYQHQGDKINHVIVKEDFLFVPVKKVDSFKYKGDVYNIETEDKTYLVSNAIVHNCHEHLEYYSYNSLVYLFEKNGLEIFKVEENNINGGSYRIFARHYKNGSIDFNEDLTKKNYQDFYQRIKRNKKLCVNFIKQETKKGKKVYVYGASTKGNVILQYYGLDNTMITAASERSPEKWGKYTIGSWIPIVSEEEARRAKPDYFLVLPWAFFDEFYQREKEWRSGGGKFIVPLPEFRVVE